MMRQMLRIFMIIISVLAMCLPAAAQGSSPQTKTIQNRSPSGKYTPPKTPWGDPDIEGLWPAAFDIPLERDPNLGTRAVLTDEEVAKKKAQIDRKKEEDSGGSEYITGREKIDANQPPYWVEYKDAHRQASLIVDPPDGKIPPLTPEAQERRKHEKVLLGAVLTGLDFKPAFDSWEDFDLRVRCITDTLVGSMMGGSYNNGNQILQQPGYVVIRNEMVHEARVVPLERRPHIGSNIRLYMGDSRGHWEGNTLVVETTNMTDLTGIVRGGRHSDQLRLIERFTRVADDELQYQVTVDDPKTWTRPWTIQIPYKLDPSYVLYEYACHEANYGLANILAGAREDEAKKNKGVEERANDPSK